MTLTEAGWYPGRDAGQAAMLAVLVVASVGAELFPAAERAVRAFHGLSVPPTAAGVREVAAVGSVVDPRQARFDVPALNRLGRSLGVRLFPLGRTDTDAPLAVDEEGRLLMLGPGGPWLVGGTVHEGLSALAGGVAPVRLRPFFRSFPLPVPPGGPGGDLGAAVRAALVAVYVLHSTGIRSARGLRLRMTTLRGVGVEVMDEVFPLGPGSLESAAGRLEESMNDRIGSLGVRAGGCELTLGVPAPPGTEGPLATVECAVTVGGRAEQPVLTLTAGLSASLGPSAAAVTACARALADWSATTAP
ncbi:SUKH-3 domain-containing protein [Streptomyces sp. NPDC101490]|uniref:SUKH-3 domain-containing protein n=1 Tax=Streptomyces sp. NPDC101490 TaxID=3366143 RepID=UPI0038204416